MPVIKCMVSRVYCGPKFEKVRLKKDESMAIKPGQVSFFRKLIASKAIIVLDKDAPEQVMTKESSEHIIKPIKQIVEETGLNMEPVIEVDDIYNHRQKETKEPKGIEMPSINLKKNNRAKHRHKNKRK